MAKKSNGKSLLQRLRFKYKLAILNENTLEEVWRIRLSKLSVIALGFFVAVVYFFLIAFLIIKTPMRGFLPGYTENLNLKNQLTLNSLVVDSLAEEVEYQTKYVMAMRAILAGDIKVDSLMSSDSVKAVSLDYLLDASEKELAFRDSYEADEALSASLGMNDSNEVKNYLMQSPAKGRTLEAYNPRMKLYGVTLSVEKNSSVSSVLDGVVISSEYSMNNLYIMTIQHPDNIISVYKSQQPFMKRQGDKVHAGEILLTFRTESDSYLEFQLWKDGVPMDPQSFITF